MRVAIVTPYHRPDDARLAQCVASVAGQTYTNCFHVLVGDGCDKPDINSSDRLLKVSLSRNIGDYGDSPRSLGAIYAFALGADAVAFLDSDNWYMSDHIESLVHLHHRTHAQVLTSFRMLARLDGTILGVCPDSNSTSFCDTSSMLFLKSAADVATSWWTIPKAYHALDDRVIWDRIMTKRYRIACNKKATAVYRTAFRHHYAMFGELPPEGAKTGRDIGRLSMTMRRLEERAASIAPTLVVE